MQKVDNLPYPPLIASQIVKKIKLNDFIVKVSVTYNIKIPNINRKTILQNPTHYQVIRQVGKFLTYLFEYYVVVHFFQICLDTYLQTSSL